MHRWVEHTSELELAIDARSERDAFVDALNALGELLRSDRDPAPTARRQISVGAPDRATLLAAWLEELLFLAESEGFVPSATEHLEVESGGLEATVLGALAQPPLLVKAVTYHRLTFEDTDGAYRATVVLDV